MPRFWAGVDGCRGGWVLASIDASRDLTSIRAVRTFAEAVTEICGAELALVDIPIGLPSEECPRDRLCDTMARKELGPQASSVFPVPARNAAWAEDYEQACALNEQVLGRKLSKQSWGICPKIREADAVFRIAPQLQVKIRETHPELCFQRLNGGKPLQNPKKSRAGQRIRRELLRGWTTNLDSAVKQARRRYGSRWLDVDDVLDAIAAAVVARLAAEGKAGTIPLAPERDACGLAMEIVGV